MHLNEFGIVNSQINKRLDIPEELLSIVSAPAGLHHLFHLFKLFTYPNKFFVAVGHRGSDKQESTVQQVQQLLHFDTPQLLFLS